MPSRPGLHPRNRHQGEYDFGALVRACPELAPFVRRSPDGRPTVDFADGRAVRALNRALLALQYGIRGWVFPEGFLCPPVPGRADLIHHLAGLLGEEAGGRIPTGPSVRALDLGVGASCIFPLIGHAEYGWRFVGTDVDAAALASAAAILKVNGLEHAVALRLQPDRSRLFRGVVTADERFDLCLCNPPFHASAAAVRATAREKWRKLGKGAGLNFGGRDAELWCEGGELGFIQRMIQESAEDPERCRWFSSLVSKSEHLPRLQAALREAKAERVQVLEMRQGQKRSRILAWSYSKG